MQKPPSKNPFYYSLPYILLNFFSLQRAEAENPPESAWQPVHSHLAPPSGISESPEYSRSGVSFSQYRALYEVLTRTWTGESVRNTCGPDNSRTLPPENGHHKSGSSSRSLPESHMREGHFHWYKQPLPGVFLRPDRLSADEKSPSQYNWSQTSRASAREYDAQ